MATQRISILGPEQGAPARKAAGSLRLPPTMNNDVFLNALLEMPTTQQTRRSPLKWLSAMGFHIVIVAALIIVPLYTTGTIHLTAYHAPKDKVELHAATTDGTYCDSEDRFRRLR